MPSNNPDGRPPKRPSRRRWCHSRKALTEIIRNPRNTVAMRIRAIELLCCIEDIAIPETKRDRMIVRDLVQQHQMEKMVVQAVDEKMLQEEAERQAKATERALAKDEKDRERIFAEVLAQNLSGEADG